MEPGGSGGRQRPELLKPVGSPAVLQARSPPSPDGCPPHNRGESTAGDPDKLALGKVLHRLAVCLAKSVGLLVEGGRPLRVRSVC